MSLSPPITVDCRGMKCPAPILAVSRAAKAAGAQRTSLEVLADDPDFPVDVRAWCRTTGAALGDILEDGGVYTANVQLNPDAEGEDVVDEELHLAEDDLLDDPPTEETPAIPAVVEGAVEVDCRGLCCPAPILQLAKAYHKLSGEPGYLSVKADDQDFPVDLKAWCRSTGAELHDLVEVEGVFTALVGAHGATLPAFPPALTDEAPAAEAAPAAAVPAEDVADLRGLPAPRAVLELSARVLGGGEVRVLCDADVAKHLGAWAPLAGVHLEGLVDHGDHTELVVAPGAEEAPAALEVRAPAPVARAAAVAPAVTTSPVVRPAPEVPRRNATTLLVLRNDFESLMAAMMVANSSAAQGMEVDVYFSFWGVNFLRADAPRQLPAGSVPVSAKPTFLHKIMKWMMPKGPERQKMSKMHMGGMGLGMMKYFMGQQNVMGLRELMDQAVELGVRFKVCTMSMGIMGIEKQDLMDLPNIEFGGVTAFTSDARTSASSMVF